MIDNSHLRTDLPPLPEPIDRAAVSIGESVPWPITPVEMPEPEPIPDEVVALLDRATTLMNAINGREDYDYGAMTAVIPLLTVVALQDLTAEVKALVQVWSSFVNTVTHHQQRGGHNDNAAVHEPDG